MEQELTQRIKAITDQIKREIRNDDLNSWTINHYYHVATRVITCGKQGHLLFHASLDPYDLRWDLTHSTPVLYRTKHEACHKAREWRDED